MGSDLPNKDSVSIIAIDGPAGAGKSTIAKRIAKALNVSYVDTGAMYRALTLKALKLDVNLENEDDLVSLARDTRIDIKNINGEIVVCLDGEDVSGAIRTVEVTNNTFYIARASKVRNVMVDWQRKLGKKRSIVIEGRDVGTVVFPDATYKFYLDADLGERSNRRGKELAENGNNVDQGALAKEINERDQKDRNRAVGPLRQAKDAIYIDSTGLSIDEVVEKVLSHITR